ncbi:MAG: porin family protein [Bacteroidota bacterium]
MLGRYIIILTTLFFGFAASAQEFHGGVIGGIAGTQVAGDTFSGYNKAGIFFGGYVNLDVSEKSALQMELTYFQKGSRENPREKNNYQSYILRLNYIEMPLLYQYKAGRFKIEAGPSAGFLLGYYEEVDLEVISDQQGYNKPSRVTFQINLGLSYFISPNIGVGLRTNNSMLNIFSTNQTGDVFRIFDHGRYNDSLILMVYYQFK